MARVRLELDPADPPPYRFVRPGGRVEEVPKLRLRVTARLYDQLRHGPASEAYYYSHCWIDTGAFLTVISERLWRLLLPGVVTPLPFAPGTPPHERRLTIAGGTFPFDLGELPLTLVDGVGGRLTATVVAKLVRDGGSLPVPILVGLGGGVLDEHTLTAAPDPAARHGQTWTLADP